MVKEKGKSCVCTKGMEIEPTRGLGEVFAILAIIVIIITMYAIIKLIT